MKKIIVFLLITAMLMVACSNNVPATTDVNSTAPTDTASGTEPAEITPEIDWPKETIHVIVGSSPGGGTDSTCRVTNQFLERELGVSMVVSNITGAMNTIASGQVKDSKPDGYTCLYINDDLIAGQVSGYADYGVEAFECAGICLESYTVAFVTQSKWETFDSFVEYCKAHPGEVVMGAKLGSYQEQLFYALENSMDIDLKLIDVGDVAECVTNLAGGHIDCTAAPIGTLADYIESGSVIAHGFCNKPGKSFSGYEDIPTMIDLGVDYWLPKFFTYLFPKGTDAAIIEKFTAALEKVCSNSEYQETIHGMKFTVSYMNPEEAVAFINNAYNDYSRYQDAAAKGVSE